MKSVTYEVLLKIRSDDICSVDLLKGVIIRLGKPENDIIELSGKNKKTLSVYFSSYKKAVSFKSKIEKLRLKKVSVGIKSHEKSDWIAKWKKEFKPFLLTKSFGVVPAWSKGKNEFKKKENVYIDTNLSFGTGLHPTTKFVANFIERCKGKFKSFLDIGTGTGILSILACKCNATEICAIDISEDCIKCAKNNFLLNKIDTPGFKTCDFSNYKSARQYDFVAANLTTHDLIKFDKKIVSFVRPNKYLAISGVSLDNYRLIKESFKNFPLRCLKAERSSGWAALLFKKGGVL